MKKDRIGVCIAGAGGRMGRRLIRLLSDHPRLRLVGALEHAGSIEGSVDAGTLAGVGELGVTTQSDPDRALAEARVVVDFAAPAAAAVLAPLCAERGLSYLVASTGLTNADESALTAAAATTPVLRAANCSVGINVMLELVTLAAERLGCGFDVEVGEIHHRHKRDAPSGTALALSSAVREVRTSLTDVLGRSGKGPPRGGDELGIAALRGGDVSGEHTVFFFGEGERIEVTHRASTPDIFARGALTAAEWLATAKPGQYQMGDVLRSGQSLRA